MHNQAIMLTAFPSLVFAAIKPATKTINYKAAAYGGVTLFTKEKFIMKAIMILLALTLSSTSYAAFNKCKGVYVGRVSVDNNGGFSKVVFLENSGDQSGSFWVYLTGWEPQEKQQALSILMAAKLANHRVDVFTKATDKCTIGTSGQVLAGIDLSTNP